MPGKEFSAFTAPDDDILMILRTHIEILSSKAFVNEWANRSVVRNLITGRLLPCSIRGAGIRPLLFYALGHVARYRNGAARRVLGFSLNQGEGHFDVEFASGLMSRAGHGRSALQLDDTVCHGCFEAAPMGSPQVFGDNQVEILTECLRGAVAEQGGGGIVPPPNRSRIVCINNGIGDLFEDRFSQHRHVFHKLTLFQEHTSSPALAPSGP